jgi:hypothetical protein
LQAAGIKYTYRGFRKSPTPGYAASGYTADLDLPLKRRETTLDGFLEVDKLTVAVIDASISIFGRTAEYGGTIPAGTVADEVEQEEDGHRRA